MSQKLAPHLPAGSGHEAGFYSGCTVGRVPALPEGLSSPALQTLALSPRAWALKTVWDEEGLDQSWADPSFQPRTLTTVE